MNQHQFRAELHCHSNYSRDCHISIAEIVRLCERRSVSIIALTDHNEIDGAIELAGIAPDWLTVIIGEEISTAEGDLIGLYLTEKIPARLPIEETIKLIKKQGGLVLVPHPFDQIRKEALGAAVVERIRLQIDALEVYNSRCIMPRDNRRALIYARQHELVGFVGSDAHTRSEYGRSTVIFSERPDSAAEFKHLLASASRQGRWSNPFVHLETWWVKRRKRRANF